MPVTGGRRYISGHNLRGFVKTAEHRARIGEGQRRAWQTKRQRKPIGSSRISARGYRVVKIVAGEGRWVPEHILVVQALRGRPLGPTEQIHHINGIKTDNRPENLHVFDSFSEHTKAHWSLSLLMSRLLEEGIIGFDREAGLYRWLQRSSTVTPI
jgi:hypothetical protein